MKQLLEVLKVACWQLPRLGLLLLLQNLEHKRVVRSKTVPGEKWTICWQLRRQFLGIKIILSSSFLKPDHLEVNPV